MSNFMHKVKDAMTDRDSRDADRGYNEPGQDNYGSSNAPGNTDTNTRGDTNPTGRSSNPFGSNRGEGTGRHAKYNDSQNVGEPGNTRTGNQNISGRSGPDPYAQSRAGGATNAGPHDSAMANKMDPRVDSDMDHRANPAGTEGERPNVAHAQGFNPSNTHLKQQQQEKQQPQHLRQQPGMQQSQQQQQPGMQGFDNHKSSEENYTKSTQEHKAHTQPGTSGADPMTSQDDYSASTQENKSQSTTSHSAPCQTNVGAESGGMGGTAQPMGGNAQSGGMGGTAQPMGGNAQQGYGDNTQQGFGGNAQQGFGGNAAAGGSSYGGDTGGGRSGAQGQNADPLNKLDPRTTRANEQQNLAGNQRGY